MEASLDHVVLWVSDALRSVEFYERVVGLPGERVAEFRDGKVPFPSIRVGPTSILDLAPMEMAAGLNATPGAEGSAGHRVNHVCLAMSRADFEALRGRLEADGQRLSGLKNSSGARGDAPETFYFRDPDGNILEARYYA